MPLDSGMRLGPYEIVGLLGAGGMGEVYRANSLDRHDAVTYLAMELVEGQSLEERLLAGPLPVDDRRRAELVRGAQDPRADAVTNGT
jgi:serine/threonine protein kinase